MFASSGDGIASRTKIGGDGVTFTFPPGVGEDVERMVGIVVKGELWLHSVIGDLVIPLKTPSGTGVLKSLADGEKAQSGSLYERFRRVNDKLSEAVQAGPPQENDSRLYPAHRVHTCAMDRAHVRQTPSVCTCPCGQKNRGSSAQADSAPTQVDE